MKNLKKILALILALSMVLALSVTVFADDDPVNPDEPGGETPAAPAYDYPLTVSGLDEGDVAHFYQIIQWVGDAEGNVSGWAAAPGFESILTEAVLKQVLNGIPAGDDTPAVPKGISSELAGQLARAAKTLESNDVTANEDGEAVLENAAEGTFMAIITPVDPDTVYNPVFVSADYNKTASGDWAVNENATYSDEAAAKKNEVTLEKKADTDPENLWDDQNQGNDDFYWTTTAIGDTVTFTVETTIPGYGAIYTNPVFKLTDKLTDLELDENSISLELPENLVEDVDYTVTASSSGYTIEFSSDYLKTVSVPTAVKVTYDAIVTTTASLHVNTEKNEVSTEFSHNPSDESDHGFKKDTTQHYTFTLDADGVGGYSGQEGKKTSEIVKIGVDEDGKPITETKEYSQIDDEKYWEGPLAGAKFKLYTDEDCENEYIPVGSSSGLVIESGEDGRMTIAGLDAGMYYLQESEAPTGFVRDTAIHKIEIIAVTTPVTVTEYTTDGITWISAEEYDALTEDAKAAYKSFTYTTDVLSSYTVEIDDIPTAEYHFVNNGTDAEIVWSEEGPVELPFPITNTKGNELPSTGGIGTTIFYVLGGLLVLGACVVLISRKRVGAAA